MFCPLPHPHTTPPHCWTLSLSHSIVMSLSTQALHTRAIIKSFFKDNDKINENVKIMMIVFAIPFIPIAAPGLAEAIVRNLNVNVTIYLK